LKSLLAIHHFIPFSALLSRIDPLKVEAMANASKEDLTGTETQDNAPAGNGEMDKDKQSEQNDFDTFAELDQRVALILNAE
ncbi:methionine--tRNA ligase, partial [Pseudomonas syringae pv. tagetis]